MTMLSVNINKIALLRNSRGRNYPSVESFAAQCLQLGAHGITLHPRPDQRHARYSDITSLKALCDSFGAELNVEGYPTPAFLDAVLMARPAQCTLVPDDPAQLTSDHGWQVAANEGLLRQVIARLKAAGIRVSLFMDHSSSEFALARAYGADRIELYTEAFAQAYASSNEAQVLGDYADAAANALLLGLGVNAGHDLSLENLARFLTIPEILEVSIGHALVAECIEQGINQVVPAYLEILTNAS